MLRVGVFRRVALKLADLGILRERIEEALKRGMIVRWTDVEAGPGEDAVESPTVERPPLRQVS